MTWNDAYTSFSRLYKILMFPADKTKTGWTMSQIDEMDVHFFNELMDLVDEIIPEKEVYLSEIW